MPPPTALPEFIMDSTSNSETEWQTTMMKRWGHGDLNLNGWQLVTGAKAAMPASTASSAPKSRAPKPRVDLKSLSTPELQIWWGKKDKVGMKDKVGSDHEWSFERAGDRSSRRPDLVFAWPGTATNANEVELYLIVELKAAKVDTQCGDDETHRLTYVVDEPFFEFPAEDGRVKTIQRKSFRATNHTHLQRCTMKQAYTYADLLHAASNKPVWFTTRTMVYLFDAMPDPDNRFHHGLTIKVLTSTTRGLPDAEAPPADVQPADNGDTLTKGDVERADSSLVRNFDEFAAHPKRWENGEDIGARVIMDEEENLDRSRCALNVLKSNWPAV